MGAEHGALQQMQWGVKGFFNAGVSRPGEKRSTEILLCMIKKKCISTFHRFVYDLEGGGGSTIAVWCVNVRSAKSPEEMRQKDEQRWEGLVSRKCHQSPPPPYAVRHPAATNTQCKLYAFSTII